MLVFNPLVIFFHIINDEWCPLVFVHRATDNAAGTGLLPAHADGRQHMARPQSAQVPLLPLRILHLWCHSIYLTNIFILNLVENLCL